MSDEQTFETILPILEKELEKRKPTWRLKAITHMDFDDVKQEIITHVWKKFHLWDQKRPFLNWVNTVISHQLANKIRNVYTNYARPCVGTPPCDKNEGGNLCAYTPSGIQCNECPLYADWERGKQYAYNIKLPQTLEHHENDAIILSEENIDVEEFIQRIDPIIKTKLPPVVYKIFRKLYIEHKDEKVVARDMGYKTREKSRSAGYKQMLNHKKHIKRIIIEILAEEEYNFI